jgi:2-dehydro-3-deoxyphosphogluconate aldolase/(4S)-4-hydroxy-2-oxoglutarate aldolase
MKSLFPDGLLQRIRTTGVVAVLIIEDREAAVPLAKALLDGRVDAIELTLRTPVALDCLRDIRQHVPEILVGAGTVLNPSQVDQIVAAGASFGVAPGTNPAVIRRATELGLPFAPGVMTPTDIETAIQAGCREMKFFPAEHTGGLSMLGSIRAPFAHLGVQFIPLGGVTAANMGEYLNDPGVLAVGGSWLAKPDLIRSKNWTAIRNTAMEASQIAAVRASSGK